MRRRGKLLAGMFVVLWAVVVAIPGPGTAKQGHRGIAFGVVGMDFPTSSDFRLMQQGNVHELRFLLSWPGVQPSQGPCTSDSGSSCHWGNMDLLMTRAAQRRVPVVFYLYGTPAWASHRHGAQATRFNPMLTKSGRSGWKHFVAAAVDRYKPGGTFWQENPPLKPEPVRHWQVWNEQNSSNSFKPDPSANAYAKLLKVTSTEIRQHQPGADIMLGGMFGTPGGGGAKSQSAWGFLNRLYAVPGIKSSFDDVAVHPYARGIRGVRYQIEKIRKVMAKNGDADTKTWVTELGWGSDAKHVDNPLVKTPRGQKHLLERSFQMLNSHRRSWKLGGVTWFSWRDPAQATQICEFCGSAGLFTKRLKPKPSWKAFVSFTGGQP